MEPGTAAFLDAQPSARGLGRNHIKVVEYRAAGLTDAERVDESGRASTPEAVGEKGGALRSVLGNTGKARERFDRSSRHDARESRYEPATDRRDFPESSR